MIKMYSINSDYNGRLYEKYLQRRNFYEQVCRNPDGKESSGSVFR